VVAKRNVAPRGFAAASIVALTLSGCAQQPVASQPAEPAAPAIQPPAATPPKSTAAPPEREEKPSPPIERGRVSVYGAEFAGKKTASGDRFDPEAMTMAHRTLPFGTLVRVTNVENGRSVEVRVNDRGPAIAGRIADLSLAAARKIDMIQNGVVDAILEVVEPPPH
jgi:rare lipoprotein A